MGQYTWYVWSSVGIVLAGLAWLTLSAILQHRQVNEQLKRAGD